MIKSESTESAEPASTRMLRVGIDRATMRGRWLGTRLREHRRAVGMKSAEVAKRVGRTAGTISKRESGDIIRGPSEIFHLLNIYRPVETHGGCMYLRTPDRILKRCVGRQGRRIRPAVRSGRIP